MRASIVSLNAILIPLCLLLCACSGPSSTLTYTEAPRLDFECSFSDALGCDPSNAGKSVFIGLHDNVNLNCAGHLSLLSLNPSFDQLAYSFDYSSLTQTSAQGGILTGLATHWVNSSLMPVYSLQQKTYRVCAFIDFNGNQALDVNEPIEESLIEIGAAFFPLSSWSNY